MFPCRLQPEMCVVWKHLCLARCRDAWYAHGRQRDSSPAGADVLAPTCVGVFFLGPVAPAIKKDRILFEAGLAPSSSPAALCPFPYQIFRSVEPKQFCPVAPAIKKERILFEAGLAPSSAPALYILLPRLDDRRQKEHSAEAECSSFGLFCFGWLVPNQAAFFALACAASALLPSTTRSIARMTSRMARIARM